MDLHEIKKPGKMHSITEVAKFMEISKGTLYRLVKNGKIDYINIAKTGNRHIIAFTGEDVQRYYDSVQNSIKRPEAINQ